MKYRRGYGSRRPAYRNNLTSILAPVPSNNFLGSSAATASPTTSTTTSFMGQSPFQQAGAPNQNKENSNWNLSVTMSSVPKLVTQQETRAALNKAKAMRKPRSSGWSACSAPIVRSPPGINPGTPLNRFNQTNTASEYSGYFGFGTPVVPYTPSVPNSILSPMFYNAHLDLETQQSQSTPGVVQSPWVTRESTAPNRPGDTPLRSSSYSVKELIDMVCGEFPSDPPPSTPSSDRLGMNYNHFPFP